MPATRKNNSGGLDNGGFRAPPKRWRDMSLVRPGVSTDGDVTTVVVPVYTKAPQAIYARDQRSAAGQTKSLAAMYSAQGDAVAATMCSMCPQWTADPFIRARICDVMFTRMSPGVLDSWATGGSQKHVIDMWCAWVVLGRKCITMDRRRVGDYDGHVLLNEDLGTGMVSWRFKQERTRAWYGVKIAMKLSPASTRSTTPTNQPSSSTEPLEK
jgi:hypothetical protein